MGHLSSNSRRPEMIVGLKLPVKLSLKGPKWTMVLSKQRYEILLEINYYLSLSFSFFFSLSRQTFTLSIHLYIYTCIYFFCLSFFLFLFLSHLFLFPILSIEFPWKNVRYDWRDNDTAIIVIYFNSSRDTIVREFVRSLLSFFFSLRLTFKR